MSFEFNLPNFQVETASERRMYSYLYQTVQQLNWAMKHIETAESSGGGYVPVKRVSAASGEIRDEKTPMETFAELKSLIIKSADIVNAYYDTISARLEGLYVAQSEFGEYVEATKLELEANSKGITQNYSNIQGIQTNLDSAVDNMQTDVGSLRTEVSDLEGTVGTVQGDVGALEGTVGNVQKDVDGLQGSVDGLSDKVSAVQADVGSVQEDVAGVAGEVETVKGDVDGLRQDVGNLSTIIVETSAYIKTGVIDTDSDGIPIYGLEIGQTNEVGGQEIFNKYARFSSSRLSFYDQNDTEVAYISDYKLYITNVHITGNLTIGHYEIDTSDGLAFLWVGGGST